MNLSPALISLTTLLPTLLVGFAFWFSVRSRRGVLFGVSVPLSFADSAEGKSLIARYRSRVLSLTIATAVSCLPVVTQKLPWLFAVMMPCLIIGSIVMWQLARRKVKPHMIAPPLERSTGIGADSGAAGWFAAIALALVPLAATWLYLRRHWEEIPARFPIHWDFNGVANSWSNRSAGSVAAPLIIGAAAIAFMIFIAAFMRLAPAINRQRAIHVILPILAIVSWSMSLLFCWTGLMPLGRSFSPSGLIVLVVAHLVIVLGIVVWALWRLMKTQGAEAYDGTPDAMWRAGGIVYYNPADAAVIVPKRLGWGWTLNFGRPAAWWYLGVLLLLVLGVGGLPFLLK